MSEFALQMRQISKTYFTVRANSSINFNVRKGTIHALAGENGAGKSTLMKILFGMVEPDPVVDSEAGIFINGHKVKFKSSHDAIASGIGMVQQHFALAGPLTALDNIILGAEPLRAGLIDRSQAQAVLEKLGSALHVPWFEETDELSVGVQQRIEILKLLFRKAGILILDEPTAVLTPQETEVFFELLKGLKAEGRTVVLITHKLHEILNVCDEVTVIRHGKVTAHFEVRGLTKDKIVHAMIGREVKPVTKKAVNPGDTLVSLKDISVSRGEQGSLKNFTLDIRQKEIVGIAGVEGNGQQALIEALLRLRKYSGEIKYKNQELPETTKEIREKLNFGLISEDRHEQSLWLDASVTDNCLIGFTGKFSRYGFLNSKACDDHASEILSRYEVKMSSVNQPVRFLSGGNQQKIVLAREINARSPEFLIASQPTRGVDVGAIEFIHHQILELQSKGSAVLLVSSELEELCALSDRIIVLFEGRIAGEFMGPRFDLKLIGEAMTAGGSHARH